MRKLLIVGKMFVGLAVCAVFIVLAMVVGLVMERYTGLDENIVWFIFGGAYFQTCQKLGL